MGNLMTIKAESRKEVGKKIAKNLRKEGKLPAVIYGGDKDAAPITLLLDDVKEILKSEKGENTLLEVKQGKINVNAILKEVQYDYLSDNIIHVDLLRIDPEQPLVVTVPVKINGIPIGVKVDGGTFDFITREVKIKSLPALIPANISLDVGEMRGGDSLKAEDLVIGEDIEIISAPNSVICAVTIKSTGMEDEAEEVEEVEGEGEGEGEGEEAGGEASAEAAE